MTKLDENIRRAVKDLGDRVSSPAVPGASLGQRALTAVSRKRRRRMWAIPATAAAVAATVVAVSVAIPDNPFPDLHQPLAAGPGTIAGMGQYVVSSYDADYKGRRYVLDTSDSSYRRIDRAPAATSPPGPPSTRSSSARAA